MKTDLFLKQLDALISAYADRQERTYSEDIPDYEEQSLLSRSIAAIHRIAGTSSSYSVEVGRVRQQYHHTRHIDFIIGIMKGLRDDLDAGYLQTFAEVVHAEVFADFIEMASHLLDNGYKDAAAVIIGSTLESHLRKLAVKNGVAVEVDSKPIKAERLNQERAKAGVYTVLDQKNVTAWLDLRNKAAHGNYGDYSIDQVRLLVASVQDFITRHPA